MFCLWQKCRNISLFVIGQSYCFFFKQNIHNLYCHASTKFFFYCFLVVSIQLSKKAQCENCFNKNKTLKLQQCPYIAFQTLKRSSLSHRIHDLLPGICPSPRCLITSQRAISTPHQFGFFLQSAKKKIMNKRKNMLKNVNNKRFIAPPVIKSLKTDQRKNNTLLSFLLIFKFKKWTFVNHHLEAVHQPAAEVKTFWRAWRSLSSTAVWRGVKDHMTNVPPNVKCCDQMSRWSFHTIFYEYIFWLLLNY